MGRRLRRRRRRRACRSARQAPDRRRSPGSARRTRARAPRAARSGRRLPGRQARALRGHAPWNLPSYPALSPAQHAPSYPYPDQAPHAPPRQQSTGHTHTYSLQSRLPRRTRQRIRALRGALGRRRAGGGQALRHGPARPAPQACQPALARPPGPLSRPPYSRMVRDTSTSRPTLSGRCVRRKRRTAIAWWLVPLQL